ncbi:MAG: efflux RND transporter periplasmic adaptor subunit [Nitrospiria bacterium]
MLIIFFLNRLTFAQAPPPAKVVVSPIVNETVQDQILLIGTVESWRTSRVATEAAGRVESLPARRGKAVRHGDLLAKLGASDLLLQLKGARARRKAAVARLEMAQEDLKRTEKLFKENLVSEKNHRDATLRVRELEKIREASEAEELQLKDLLEKKEVRAPFDGIVTQELIEEGEWVEKGGSIVQLVDISKVRILVDMPEKYVSRLKIGGTANVRLDALGNGFFPGSVHALIPQGDRDARLFPLEVHVKNKGLRIKEGMLAKVSFDLGLSRSVLMVEKDAVIRRGSQIYIFIVKEGKAHKQNVTLGLAKNTLIEVIGPLQEGAQVVIRGNERLRDGQLVQIVP